VAVVIELWERELLNERFGPVWEVRKEARQLPPPIPRRAARDTPRLQRQRRQVLRDMDKGVAA
jgi:hypothetical protein